MKAPSDMYNYFSMYVNMKIRKYSQCFFLRVFNLNELLCSFYSAPIVTYIVLTKIYLCWLGKTQNSFVQSVWMGLVQISQPYRKQFSKHLVAKMCLYTKNVYRYVQYYFTKHLKNLIVLLTSVCCIILCSLG